MLRRKHGEIGEITGMAVYAHVRTRLGNDMAAAETVISELEQKGMATARFTDSFGVENTIEIRRIETKIAKGSAQENYSTQCDSSESGIENVWPCFA